MNLKALLNIVLKKILKKRYSVDELLKHDFITKFSKGRKYINIEKFRLESEEDYKRLLKINDENKKMKVLIMKILVKKKFI